MSVQLETVFESRAEDKPSKLYELRTYVTNPGKLVDLNARFREHTMKLFEKHGMENIAYWTPLEDPGKDNTLVYVIAHKDQEAAEASWRAFGQDSEWRAVARRSEENGRILASPPERVYMMATDFSPEWPVPQGESQERIFELRKYTTAEGRRPALLQRFRDGELALFEKAGLTNIAYWTPVEDENMLIYVVAHDNKEAAEASWQKFRSDPEWLKLKETSEAAGPIVTKVERQFLTPVDYSPRK
jgi:hypothetical protein